MLNIVVLLSSIVNAALSLLVWYKGGANVTSRIFSIFAACVAFWCFAAMQFWVSDSPLFWGRLMFLGPILMAPIFVEFSKLFPHRTENLNQTRLALLFIPTLFFLSLVPTGIIVKEIIFPSREVVYGVGNLLFGIYFSIYFLVSFANLVSNWKISRGRSRLQFFYLFTGIFVSTLVGVTTNLILPLLGTSAFNRVGPAGTVFFVAMVAYAILRHRLLDIEVIIKKTLVFAGLSSFIFGVFAFVTFLAKEIFSKYIEINPLWMSLISVVLIVVGYDPLRTFLVNITDKYLFQKKYDYKKLLQDASRGISQIKSLSHLLKLITHFIAMRMRLRNAAVLIYDKKNRFFQFAYPRGYPQNGWLRDGHVFPENKPLIRHLLSKRRPITLEQIKERTEAKASGQENFQTFKQEMEELSASCLIPSFLGDLCQGILVLGEKKSDEPFTDEDLALLYAIAQESAVAMENARLYDEAVERAAELERNYKELESAKTDLMRSFKQSEELRKREEALKEEALADKKKIQEMGAQLIERERNRVLGDMAGGLAHELRHPFSYIQSSVYFIKKLLPKLNAETTKDNREEMEKKILGYVDTINKANEQQITIVKTLEAFAKREETGQDLMDLDFEHIEFNDIRLKSLVKYTLDFDARFLYDAKNTLYFPIDIDAPNDLPPIKGNHSLLRRVFLNLLTNAYDAMKESSEKKMNIKIYSLPKDLDFLQIEFQDTGCGIPEPYKQKVWDYLFTTKTHRGGSGIGLFWCKLVVETVHKGKIWFESEEGKGTTFFVKLPIWKG